ncbi:hypothetical protein NHX12_028105 [Muraenolepis orangiensis]|uniref:Uncharacterized protein n=1 Tax=Muraenolepis orangiensis TaxID=630683 RepID=A0A9Q0EKD7_9TELE|nr:hypothetical protein NHX12_028105 [Muraenolepis orangiensis]
MPRGFGLLGLLRVRFSWPRPRPQTDSDTVAATVIKMAAPPLLVTREEAKPAKKEDIGERKDEEEKL